MVIGNLCERSPFTASQWRELEHQTFVFNHMSAGTPVPHDLILPTIRSFHPEPNLPDSTRICYGMTLGKNKEQDPEPQRCRRTDGKKWRCSREAYPDSKYCERHMHRGRNRSRKPVEVGAPINGDGSSGDAAVTTTISPNPLLCPRSLAVAAASEGHHLGHPHSSGSDTGFSPQSRCGPLRFNNHATTSSLGGEVHRSVPTSVSWAFVHHDSSSFLGAEHCGPWKKDAGARPSFSGEGHTAFPGGPWLMNPFMEMGTSRVRGRRSRSPPASPEQRRSQCFAGAEEGSYKRQHCFVLGADFMSSERPAKAARGGPAASPSHLR